MVNKRIEYIMLKGAMIMKKSIIGLVFGLIVGLTLSASASSILGKAIDAIYPLYISGTRSSVDAISIEGTSYVPVRNAGEAFGYDVNFSSDVILLTKKTTQQSVSTITDDLDYVLKVSGANENTPDTSIIVPKTETITLAEYNQLEIGMSYDEAMEIIGGPGRISDEDKSTDGSYHSIIYSWYGTAGNYTSANIRFINDKLNEKLQQGLK
jgi:hypothetical protein